MVNLKDIKAVLFDLDGVLIDACDWHYKALNKALKHVAGIEISPEDHVKTFNGLPTKTKLSMLHEKGLLEEIKFEEICEAKQRFTIEVINQEAFIDNTKVSLVRTLKSFGIKIGCVTNSIRKTTELMLKRIGVFDLMDIIISNEDCVMPKPSASGYIEAMVHLSVSPGHTLIVEDSPKGLMAANATGCYVMKVKNATEVTLSNFLKYDI